MKLNVCKWCTLTHTCSMNRRMDGWLVDWNEECALNRCKRNEYKTVYGDINMQNEQEHGLKVILM